MKNLVPETKLDLETANRAVEAGFPAVEPVLFELIKWLQDVNWPVAKVLAPFLADVGLPLVPHIDHVFSTTDETWKYWVIVCLISRNDTLFHHYKQMMIRYAEHPTDDEIHHELHEVAREVLEKHGHYGSHMENTDP